MLRRSLLFLLLLAGAAGADDALRTPGEQVLGELRRALFARDEEAAERLLAEVGELYRYPASSDEAAELLRVAGEASRSKSERIVVAALRALGATGARRAAGEIERFLRSARPKPEEKPVVLAALQAAGRLRVPSLVAPLLNLARTASDATYADEALLALGAYCKAETALRKEVAGKVLDVARTIERNRRRWRRLRAPALRSLQRLIGRRLNSVQQFTDWWKRVRDSRDPWA